MFLFKIILKVKVVYKIKECILIRIGFIFGSYVCCWMKFWGSSINLSLDYDDSL